MFKRKSIFKFFLAMVLIVPMSLVLFACKEDKHNFSEEWSTSATEHWHACLDEDCDDVKDKEAHTSSEWIITKDATCEEAGSKKKECTVCHLTLEEETIQAIGHDYESTVSTYEWSDSNTKCTATRACSHDASHTITEVATLVDEVPEEGGAYILKTVTQEKTCDNDELSTFVAHFTKTEFTTQTVENVKTSEKLEHDYENSYTWSDSELKYTAVRVCKNDATHKTEETLSFNDNNVTIITDINDAPATGAYILKTVTQVGTCEDDEISTLTFHFAGEYFEDQTQENIVTADKLGHDYEISYTWGTDNASCTATGVCKRNSSHTITETATLVDEVPAEGGAYILKTVTQEKTCDNDELSTFVAHFTKTEFTTQTVENVKTSEKLEHDYENSYTWSDSELKYTAVRVCKNDATHKTEETLSFNDNNVTIITDINDAPATGAYILKTVTQVGTCEDDEISTLTFHFAGEYFEDQTQENIVTADKLGHDYEISYTWGTDNASCTATGVCKRNSSHTITETTNNISVTEVKPDFENDGKKIYTATFEDSLFETQTTSEITVEKYSSLADAFEKVKDNETITLVSNITLEDTIIFKRVGETITLDLGGFTISTGSTLTDSNTAIVFINGGTLIVKNGTINACGDGFYLRGHDNNATKNGFLKVETTLKLENDLTVNCGLANDKNYGNCVYIVGGGASLESSANLTTSNPYLAAIQGDGSTDQEFRSIKITGGTIKNENCVAMYIPNTGDVTISGGTFIGKTAVYIKAGNVSVTGGTFKAVHYEVTPDADDKENKKGYRYHSGGFYETGDAFVIDACGYQNNAITVEITGGTFETENESDGCYGIAYYKYNGNEATSINITNVNYHEEGILA